MTTNENKTVPTSADVADFLARLDDDQQRKDSESLIGMMNKISNEPPTMWGPSIIGFGSHHYKYESGREGDEPLIAFSPRKGKFALYVTYDAAQYEKELADMGKCKSSKACIYINRLSDVDMAKLESFIDARFKEWAR